MMRETDRKTRIVFMGTPEFAVHILDTLIQENRNVVGVVTVADKPAGRGKKLQMSAVKKYALDHDLKVLTPLKLKDPLFLDELKALKPDLQIVVAFRMLPEVVWSLPPLGTFNLHASLLPHYRGAAPINHAIMNGESKTGVTTFFLDHEIDTGKILMRKECEIGENETAGELHDKLMKIGAGVVIDTIQAIEGNHLEPIDQRDLMLQEVKEAPKIFKENCKIDWSLNAYKIHDFVRGLSPYPASFTYLKVSDSEEPKSVKIFKMQLTTDKSKTEPGCLWTDGKKELKVSTKDFDLKILELQIQGKKRMQIEDFLRGFSILDSMRFIDD